LQNIDIYLQKERLNQSYFFQDTSIDTFKIGERSKHLKSRDPDETEEPYHLKITFRIDNLQVNLNKKTFGVETYLANVGGLLKILMLFGAVLSQQIAKRFFMANIL